MKTLLISTLIIILGIFAFNKFQDYRRFNGPSTNYSISDAIDINYFDENIVRNYFNEIEQLNGFINTQWSANKIDVINPKKDNKKTNYAVQLYAKRLSTIKYFENLLIQSKKLKAAGFSNADIKLYTEKGMTSEGFSNHQNEMKHKEVILASYSEFDIRKGSKNMLVFEMQKLLNKNGFSITEDGVFRDETSNALKQFEVQYGFYPDGKLDLLTLNGLLDNKTKSFKRDDVRISATPF